MNYLSVEFFTIFLMFFALYWSCWRSIEIQNSLILLASYALVFTYNPIFMAQLGVYSVVIYGFARLLAKSQHKKHLILAIGFAVGNLLLFKYFDFFRANSQWVLEKLTIQWQLPAVELLLPVGISYYTFHSITYLVSVYRGEIKPDNPLDLFTFIAFFPTLIAGPICRAKEMLPQFSVFQIREIEHFDRIFALILMAMVKKLWFAAYLEDNWSDPILGNPEQSDPATVLAGLYAYTLQIYLDFSGYTDLVIALALLLGINIPQNFNMPYAATNLRDFWHRWHMSLSTWIRDYLYIPLGGNRKGFIRTQFNIVAAMLISGLWHGAASHYLWWGAMHASGMIFLNIGDAFFGRNRICQFSPALARFLTLHFVVITWAVFYTEDRDNLSAIFRALGGEISTKTPASTLFFILCFNVGLLIYPFLPHIIRPIRKFWQNLPWAIYPVVFFIVVLMISAFATSIPNFLYADF